MSARAHDLAARLRPMVRADVPEVIAIERAAYPFPWTEGILYDCLRVGYQCWVLERGGRIEGYGIMSHGAGEAHILNLCIRPAAQRQGLGERLLRHIMAEARRHDADTLLLEVRPSNEAALRLYGKLGFSQVGQRPDYYPAEGGREHALILARALV